MSAASAALHRSSACGDATVCSRCGPADRSGHGDSKGETQATLNAWFRQALSQTNLTLKWPLFVRTVDCVRQRKMSTGWRCGSMRNNGSEAEWRRIEVWTRRTRKFAATLATNRDHSNELRGALHRHGRDAAGYRPFWR